MASDETARNADSATPGATLVAALRDPRCYAHTVTDVTTLETHISWVLLTGQYAYKIKKPLKLPFLDFSTLALRRHFCEEELRLNRTFAPELYLDVVAIRGTPEHPVIDGVGPILDYAVRMRQFSQDALASRLIRARTLTPEHVVALAKDVARFHTQAGIAATESIYGRADCVRNQVIAVVDELLPLIGDPRDARSLQSLRMWIENSCARLRDRFASRKLDGFVRECHGDLHLGNVVLLNGTLTPFDCIEFSASLRWIDVMSETAFLAMDLAHEGRSDLANLFIETYLECTGDYAGISLLRFYLVYRALVRSMTHAMSGLHSHPLEAAAASSYLRLAVTHAHPGRGAIVIMHGLSGSGKSTVARELALASAGLRIRSDVERKRLHGLEALARTDSAVGGELYAAQASVATYGRLLEISRGIAEAGFPVIVDAAFLERSAREHFRRLAAQLGITFTIVSVQAAPDVLRKRVEQRQTTGTDASEATLRVLARQIELQETLSPDELRDTVIVDNTHGLSGHIRDSVVARLKPAQ